MLTPEESFICPICLDFESDVVPDWFVSTPNGHIFHFNKCIKKWLDRGDNCKCPYCDEILSLDNLTKLCTVDPNSKRETVHYDTRYGDMLLNGNASGCNGSSVSLEDQEIASRYPDYNLKIILLGDAGVGKSSLLERYTKGVFTLALTSTIGCDVSFKILNVGGKTVKLNLWDTGGQETFESISRNFVRNAHGILLVYSYGKQENEAKNSLVSIKNWIEFIDKNGLPGAAMLLVGNKLDIAEENRAFTTEQGQDVARDLGLSFFETSAKDHHNIDAAFRTLVVETLQRVESKQLEYRDPEKEKAIRLRKYKAEEAEKQREKENKCKCYV